MEEIEFDTQKGARHTLSAIYGKLKALKKRRETLLLEIARTESEIKNFQQGGKPAQKAKKRKKPHWSQAFHSFATSFGHLVAAGKNSKQNDELVARHLGDNDLFFHADIQGAPATILVGGASLLDGKNNESGRQSLAEAAVWAASYSSAWKRGVSAVDVYAVKKEQVSKHAMGGYIGRGAFAITGKREWFRSTALGLKIGILEGMLVCLPLNHKSSPKPRATLIPGNIEKQDAAKKLSAMLSVKMDDVSRLLPSGKFSIMKA